MRAASGMASCAEAMTADGNQERIHALADLIVRFGANVQPGQIVAIGSEPGKELLARAIAESAYKAGAKFVDLSVFDIHIKHARMLYAAPETLGFVPPWYGERDARARREPLRGDRAHRAGRPPHHGWNRPGARLGRDLLPRVRESIEIVNQRTTNWTAAPCPTRLPGPSSCVRDRRRMRSGRLWTDVAHICRVDEPDPVAAWEKRIDELVAVAGKLDGYDSTPAFRRSGHRSDRRAAAPRWECARLSTVDGIVHAPNLPTEEVFTTPDPERTDGWVRSTKPLFVSGALVSGLRVRFERGQAVEIEADQGADALRALGRRDAGSARLGEVALVDGESRIGALNTVFFDTLLDENAASHIALGEGLDFAVGEEDKPRVNRSELHIDFMIGSNEVAVTGIERGGGEVPLLRGGAWQI